MIQADQTIWTLDTLPKAFPQDISHYAVVGNPIAHSQSPFIHAAFAEQTGIKLVYQRLLAPLDTFEETINRFFNAGGKGLNVTVPFKQEAYAAVLSKGETRTTAATALAVNTLAKSMQVNGLRGDNTDGIGLVNDLINNLSTELKDKRILLLGAGGAARGVIVPLLKTFPASLVIANRNKLRAEQIKASVLQSAYGGRSEIGLFPTELSVESFDNLSTLNQFHIVINATSAGLGDGLVLPHNVWAKDSLAYDMMYGAKPTAFLAAAQEAGAKIADGLGMLVEQAAEAFYIWHGIRPETAPVLKMLRQKMFDKS
jgi:shikimate dehydrogenase